MGLVRLRLLGVQRPGRAGRAFPDNRIIYADAPYPARKREGGVPAEINLGKTIEFLVNKQLHYFDYLYQISLIAGRCRPCATQKLSIFPHRECP